VTFRRTAAGLALLVLTVGACTSSSGKHGAATTATATSAPALPGVSVRACPERLPRNGGVEAGTAVQGLAESLVPITASSVQVCRYGWLDYKLVGSALLSGSTATQFERETNRLPPHPGLIGGEGPGVDCDFAYVVTFASRFQHVGVSTAECTVVSNGAIFRDASSKWIDEVQRFAKTTNALPAASLSARIVLPTQTMATGTSMSGQVILKNDSGHALHATSCFRFVLVTPGEIMHRPENGGSECLMRYTIPVGTTTYRMTLDAIYPGCAGVPSPGSSFPACLNGNIPPFPPGQYDVTVFGASTLIAMPPPVAVRVTAAH